MKLPGLLSNFHIHVSMSDLHIPMISPPILLQKIGGPIVGICKSLTDWERGRRVYFLGIHKSDLLCSSSCQILHWSHTQRIKEKRAEPMFGNSTEFSNSLLKQKNIFFFNSSVSVGVLKKCYYDHNIFPFSKIQILRKYEFLANFESVEKLQKDTDHESWQPVHDKRSYKHLSFICQFYKQFEVFYLYNPS